MVTRERTHARRAGSAARPAIGRYGRSTSIGRRGARVARAGGRGAGFCLPATAQHMKTEPRLTREDVLGGLAALLGVVAWGTVLSLIGG